VRHAPSTLYRLVTEQVIAIAPCLPPGCAQVAAAWQRRHNKQSATWRVACLPTWHPGTPIWTLARTGPALGATRLLISRSRQLSTPDQCRRAGYGDLGAECDVCVPRQAPQRPATITPEIEHALRAEHHSGRDVSTRRARGLGWALVAVIAFIAHECGPQGLSGRVWEHHRPPVLTTRGWLRNVGISSSDASLQPGHTVPLGFATVRAGRSQFGVQRLG
jgi:hypothetical protein